tara:strand:+ start:10212 stop:10346 length:135 start_codon:yes stop_codon:yes gene_type:complete
LSRNIGAKPSDGVTNKSVMALQKIVDDLKREIESLKVRVTKLGG